MKNFRYYSIALLAFAFVIALSSCPMESSGSNDKKAQIPTITGVTVEPATANVTKGETQQFTATVEGENLQETHKAVAWSVEGGASGTSISDTGLLTVAVDETAVSLTVKATSSTDTTKAGTATVTVGNSSPLYKVTFNSNGGSDVAPITAIASGSTISLPTPPAKGLWIFNGWFTENNGKGIELKSDTVITTDLLVNAKWISIFEGTWIETTSTISLICTGETYIVKDGSFFIKECSFAYTDTAWIETVIDNFGNPGINIGDETTVEYTLAGNILTIPTMGQIFNKQDGTEISNSQKSVTIRGLNGFTGKRGDVWIVESLEPLVAIAASFDYPEIISGEYTVDLYGTIYPEPPVFDRNNYSKWSGNGNYYIAIIIAEGERQPYDLLAVISDVKINFTQENTIINYGDCTWTSMSSD